MNKFGIAFAVLFFIPTLLYGADITLTWDPNVEPDLAGYKVYYKKGTSGSPYNGTGLTYNGNTANSPIDVGLTTQVTLSDLSSTDVYFFVVTAYDNEVPSLESGYSNEVSTFRISSPSSGFFVGPSDYTSFEVRGNYLPNTVVEIFVGSTSLGTTQADSSGLWSKFVNFSSINDGSITLTAKAGALITPAVTGLLNKTATKGDVNADGNIDSGDAILILRYSEGLITLTETEKWCGNVTGKTNNDDINSDDALKILRYSVGLITNLN
jgi:hypothetical protein